jgi:hypothetical protein
MSVGLRAFFPILPVGIASLFVDSERALLLAVYGTLWVPFRVLLSSFFRVVKLY